MSLKQQQKQEILGHICNPVVSRLREEITPPYSACVSQIWSQFQRNLEVLEAVQWRATEMIRWLENVTCGQRLKISFVKKKKKIWFATPREENAQGDLITIFNSQGGSF